MGVVDWLRGLARRNRGRGQEFSVPLWTSTHAEPTPASEPKLQPIQLSVDQLAAVTEILSPHWDAECLFVHGPAGTGKSEVIKEVCRRRPGRVMLLAPTGIAAINIGGATIHSQFVFAPNALPLLDDREIVVHSQDRRAAFEAAELIIIDEVSMVRCDLMDAIDYSLRLHLDEMSRPFGGKRVVLVGDLLQLPPVDTGGEAEVLRAWPGNFFFDSFVWRHARLRVLTLTTDFRHGAAFAALLQQLRAGEIAKVVPEINRLAKITKEIGDALLLGTTNEIVDQHNDLKLRDIRRQLRQFEGKIEGSFQRADDSLPVPKTLQLKVGARVMIAVNNLPLYCNGTGGVVVQIGEDKVDVLVDSGGLVTLHPYKWEKNVWQRNSEGLLEKKTVGSYTQIPLRLAWAITIHRAQGLTLDSAHLRHGPGGFFAGGMAYTAVSRVREASALSFDHFMSQSDFTWDPRALAFVAKTTLDSVWPPL